MKWIFGLLLALWLAPVLAQEGPGYPCQGCVEDRPLFTMPSSALWYAAERPGTGLSITVQNGFLIGVYYGFTPIGAPLWYLFTGPLEQPEDAPNRLRLTADLQRVESGPCLGCAYQVPDFLPSPGKATLEFDQANHATLVIDGGEPLTMLPFIAGVDYTRLLPSYTDYEFPDLDGTWVAVQEIPQADGSWEYGNGSCIGCAYTPVKQIALPGTITLSFDQRHHGTYRIDGGEPIHIVPLMANSVFVDEVVEQTRYRLPDSEGAWVLTFKAEAGEGWEFERIASLSGVFGAKEVWSGNEPRAINWIFSVTPEDPDPAAHIQCTTYGEGSPPPAIPLECKLHFRYPLGMFPEFRDGVEFPLPYANIGDGRIVSEDPVTGIRLEAFRIGHD